MICEICKTRTLGVKTNNTTLPYHFDCLWDSLPCKICKDTEQVYRGDSIVGCPQCADYSHLKPVESTAFPNPFQRRRVTS